MSKAEIFAVLPKLSPAEREEIRLKLAELDGNDWLDEDDPLTNSDKTLIEARIEAHEKNPQRVAIQVYAVKDRKETYGLPLPKTARNCSSLGEQAKAELNLD
jgi:hypothetical protein